MNTEAPKKSPAYSKSPGQFHQYRPSLTVLQGTVEALALSRFILSLPQPPPPLRESHSFVVMGTGAKESNTLASRFLGESPDSDYSVFRFAKDPARGRAFELLPVKGYLQRFFFADEFESGPLKGELAVLQRITLERGKVVFLCAGKDSRATTIVARYLADNWRILLSQHKDRRNGDFANLYLFSHESSAVPRLLASVS